MKALNLLVIGVLISVCTSAQILATKKARSGNHPSLSKSLYQSNSNQQINSTREFIRYKIRMSDQLSVNSSQLNSLRKNVPSVKMNERKKLNKFLTRLETENNELIAELDTYIKFGYGDWNDFRKEFTAEIIPVSRDISYLHNKFISDDLIAGK
jgi:hypothetical protein